jgi:hypothetical protein
MVFEKVNFVGYCTMTDSHANISSEDSKTVLVGYALYHIIKYLQGFLSIKKDFFGRLGSAVVLEFLSA